MSEWSGNLYFFYTEKEISYVLKSLIEAFQSNFNYNYQNNDFLDEKALLFYRDQDMLNSHYENGYHLNTQGLGCIGVEAKIVSINGIAKLHTFENLSDFEPYNIHLVFNKVTYFTLILPELPDKSNFCSEAYQIFYKTLL